IPPGYYDDAEGLYDEELRTALYNIISPHSIKSYSSLWDYFFDTDRKENGYVWDMYSDVPGGEPSYNYVFFDDQCGNYSGEGSCYNREHSFPKSWFDNQSPMNTDLYHLYPTDGYTNGQRGNYPFGETENPNWTSTNGSKRGSSSYPGYTGTIFEPIDEYKGDFARTYFYMITRYKYKISSWNSPMLQGDGFSDWALSLLLDWHSQDPVSDKETNRNNEVYNIQINRNPFIDHPEYAIDIWDSTSGLITYTSEVHLWYADHSINISAENSSFETIVVYDTMGRTIGEYRFDNNKVVLDQSLISGVYIAQLQGSSVITQIKFVVLNF
ncbi:MAG: hypothetical protein DRI54_04015, partial [Bacteroidetes bacterium]